LTDKPQRHEKVRFSRRDSDDLNRLPSALSVDQRRLPRGSHRRNSAFGRWIWRAFFLCAVLFSVGYGMLKVGIAGDQLTDRARTAIAGLLGPKFEINLAGARIGVTENGRLGLTTNGLNIRPNAEGNPLAAIGRIDLGLSFGALLRGDLAVQSVTIRDANLVAPPRTPVAAADRQPPVWPKPDEIIASVYDQLDRFIALVDRRETSMVALRNITIDLAAFGMPDPFVVTEGTLLRTDDDEVQISASLAHKGRVTTLNLTLTGIGRHSVRSFRGQLADIPFRFARTLLDFGVPLVDAEITEAELTINFEGKTEPDGRVLRATAQFDDLHYRFRDRIDSSGDANIILSLHESANKLELSSSTIRLGRSVFRVEGAVGPNPDAATSGEGWRFELLSNDTYLAANDVQSPPIRIQFKTSGGFTPKTRRLSFHEIALNTPDGTLRGQGDVSFTGTFSPAVFLALQVKDLPVAQLKQAWPAQVAYGARMIMINRVFGGIVREGEINLAVQADRLGSEEDSRPGESSMRAVVEGTRFDLVGDLPPVRDADAIIVNDGTHTEITVDKGTAYLASGKTATLSEGKLVLKDPRVYPFFGDATFKAAGDADALAEMIALKPVDAMRLVPFAASDLKGTVTGSANIRFPISFTGPAPDVTYSVAMDFADLSIAKPLDGQAISKASGKLSVTNAKAVVTASADLNGLPAEVELIEPIQDKSVQAKRSVALILDDKAREVIAPGLNDIMSGPMAIELTGSRGKSDTIKADLTDAVLDLSFAGWKKGRGIPASATFRLAQGDGLTRIDDLVVSGKSFRIAGAVTVDKAGLRSGKFGSVQLNPGDSVSLTIERRNNGYDVKLDGRKADVRALIRQASDALDNAAATADGKTIRLDAKIENLVGFGDTTLRNVTLTYVGAGGRIDKLTVNGATPSGGGVVVNDVTTGDRRTFQLQSSDAGSVLRFLDIYPRMRGGTIVVDLGSSGNGPQRGSVQARKFAIVDEPRLESLVASKPNSGKSLGEVLDGKLKTSVVDFDEGLFDIVKGKGSLEIQRGFIRGPVMGMVLGGFLYDKNNRMLINGTFMPAYGINRVFAEIPIFGQLLGNGSDRGLLGITFRLTGDPKQPNVQVNPVSLIAPGIFRQIFEYR
jgi:hypothetical protein